MKGIKVGVDVNSDFRYRSDGQDWDFTIQDPLAIGVEMHVNETFDAGLEMMMNSNIEAVISAADMEISHISLYGLYKLYSDENITFMPKFGYSTMNFDINIDNDYYDYYYGGSPNVDSEGGLLFGFQIEYKDVIHVSYTRHTGKFEVGSGYDDPENYKTLTSRFNISYMYSF